MGFPLGYSLQRTYKAAGKNIKYLGECHTEVAIVLGKGWANRFETKVWYSLTESILSIKQAVERGGGMVLKDTHYPLYKFQTDTITFSESKYTAQNTHLHQRY